MLSGMHILLGSQYFLLKASLTCSNEKFSFHSQSNIKSRAESNFSLLGAKIIFFITGEINSDIPYKEADTRYSRSYSLHDHIITNHATYEHKNINYWMKQPFLNSCNTPFTRIIQLRSVLAVRFTLCYYSKQNN